MRSPEISVIVPLYNARRFLRTCLESILQQTFRDFELIIVDDRSTDGSFELALEYKDPRVKILQTEKNSGNAVARNLGLNFAHGKYVYFVDDDDIILEQTLEIFYQAAEISQADVVHMNSYFELFEDERIEKIFDRISIPRTLPILKDRIESEFLSASMQPMPWKNFLRRDFLLEHKLFFPIVECCEDMLYFNSLTLFARVFVVIDSTCYLHRIHNSAMTSSSAKRKLRWTISSLPPAIEFIEDIFKKLGGIFTRETEIAIEVSLLNKMIMSYAFEAYTGGIAFEEIEQVVSDELKPVSHRDFVPMLIHTMIINLLNLNELQNRMGV